MTSGTLLGVPAWGVRMLVGTPLADEINENITLNMQYLHSTAENRA